MGTATHALAQEIWPGKFPQVPSCITIIRKVLAADKAQLSHIRKHSRTKRTEFLHALRERIALRKSPSTTDPEKALRNIEQQLRRSENYKRIKRAVKREVRHPLNKVKVEEQTTDKHGQPNGSKAITIDTRVELEKAILHRSQKHFSQSLGTPWTTAPLKYMGSDANFDLYTNQEGDDIKVPEHAFIKTTTVIDIL